MLLRLAYLSAANVFALLRLLAVSDRDKEVEILVLRHQVTVLERQLGKTRPRFSLVDRAFLAALLHRLPWHVLGRFRLLVQPDTVLRWHRDLLARRHAARSRPGRPGRPRALSVPYKPTPSGSVASGRITSVQRDASVRVGRAASAVIWSRCHLVSH